MTHTEIDIDFKTLEYDSNKPNLILDLDHTLIVSTCFTDNSFDFSFLVKKNLLVHSIFDSTHYVVLLRPYLFLFLEKMSNLYNIFIVTNSTFDYAKLIIVSIILKLNYNPFQKIYCRKSSSEIIKSLYNLNLSSKNSVVIDDNEHIWKYDTKNQLLIRKFFGDENDYELKLFSDYLNEIYMCFMNNNKISEKIIEINSRYHKLISLDEYKDIPMC